MAVNERATYACVYIQRVDINPLPSPPPLCPGYVRVEKSLSACCFFSRLKGRMGGKEGKGGKEGEKEGKMEALKRREEGRTKSREEKNAVGGGGKGGGGKGSCF